MRNILVVGIGPGNPEQITVQAIKALNRADVLFVPRKGADKADLAELRREIIARYVTNPQTRVVEFNLPRRNADDPSYAAGVADWHAAIAALYRDLFTRELPENGTGGLLVWGDPSLYDSTLRILERVRAAGLEHQVEVIPGITSLQALTAAHAIPLNRIGAPVLLTTGRHLADSAPATDAAVLLDGQLAFERLDGDSYDIFWGAYLGMPDEIRIAGRLSEVAGEIGRRRAEARAAHGWIMDTYLLRRRADDKGSTGG
jgi:precorrin-6A synthase